MMMLFRLVFDGTNHPRRSSSAGTLRKKHARRGRRRADHHQGQARDHWETPMVQLPPETKDATHQRHPSSSLGFFARTTARRKTMILQPQERPRMIPSSAYLVDTNCFFYKGIKVEIIDRSNKVLVIDLVPPAVCQLLRSTIAYHCQTQHRTGQSTWRTLYTYTKMDLPCCEIAKVNAIAQQLIDTINGLLSFLYAGGPDDDDDDDDDNDDDDNDQDTTSHPIVLRPRSWKEPHFLRYEHPGENSNSRNHNTNAPQPLHHVGVESHYDGSDFTWSLMLSRPDEYRGGGTYLRTLRTTLRLDQGQVLLHPGDLYHTGLDITSGVRELMICFMDGWDSMTRDSSPEADDCEEYQRNIRQTQFGQL